MIIKKVKEYISSSGIKRSANRGGVLLTTMLLAFLFSNLLLFMVEDYQVAVQNFRGVRAYYIARTVRELFLLEYYDGVEFSENPVTYTHGTVRYTEAEELTLRVQVDYHTYLFSEPLKETDFIEN